MSTKSRYPWKKWFAKEGTVTLQQGKHFDCLVHSMAQQIRNAAYRHGVQVSLVLEEKKIGLNVISTNKGVVGG